MSVAPARPAAPAARSRVGSREEVRASQSHGARVPAARRCAWLRAAGIEVGSAEIDKIAQTAAYAHRNRGEKKQMLDVVRQFSKIKAQIDFLEDVNLNHAQG